MVTARNKLFPSIKSEGYFPRPYNVQASYGKLVVFTSEHSHYSIDKAAQVMGLGTDSIVKVPVDDIGRMKVDELGKKKVIFYRLFFFTNSYCRATYFN